MEIKFRAPHAIDTNLTYWLISTQARLRSACQGLRWGRCLGCKKLAGGELPAAIDAAVTSPSGLFLLHVLIDPLLKADMAAFIDKAAMNSG